MFEENAICKMLGLKYPIFQGGMAWLGTAELASAVSEAGGLGIIGAGHMPPDVLRAEIEKVKKATKKPFGVNIMLMSPFVKEVMQLMLDERVPVVTTGAGNPGEYIPSLKEIGTKVIPVVASVALAKRLVRTGVDAVIAEGMESGGHIGELTTMALVPQVVDAVDVPVIAAGGIGDSRGVCAAFALADTIRTVRTEALSGWPVRCWQTAGCLLVFGAFLYTVFAGIDKMTDRMSDRAPAGIDGITYQDYEGNTRFSSAAVFPRFVPAAGDDLHQLLLAEKARFAVVAQLVGGGDDADLVGERIGGVGQRTETGDRHTHPLQFFGVPWVLTGKSGAHVRRGAEDRVHFDAAVPVSLKARPEPLRPVAQLLTGKMRASRKGQLRGPGTIFAIRPGIGVTRLDAGDLRVVDHKDLCVFPDQRIALRQRMSYRFRRDVFHVVETDGPV